MLGVLAKYFQDVSVLRRLLFAVVFLSPELPMFWGVVLEFATGGRVPRCSVTPDQVRALMENIQELNAAAFDTDHALQKELIYLNLPGKKPIGVTLISPASTCLLCESQLQLRKDRHSPIVIYDAKYGTIPGAHFSKFCPRRTCCFIQHYGYYSIQGKVMFNPNWNTLPYFISSRDTAFSLDILKQLDANIMIGQTSFMQQADIYNFMHGYHKDEAKALSSNDLNSRQSMDRRRLGEAFLQYALLRVAAWYPSLVDIQKIHLHDSLSVTLLNVTPLFHKAFIQKNAGHRCDTPGCGEVLVLDGNMKNSREVCFAKQAGYAEFSGLPGKAQTGCPHTPAFKSRYCSLHAPITAFPHKVQSSEDGDPIVTNKTSNEEMHAAIITSKRTTRNSTFYQVIWLGRPRTESTWEPESSLPRLLVENYEAGIHQEIQRETFTTGGQTIHTLSTTHGKDGGTEPNAKRQRTDSSDHHSDSSGSFAIPKQDHTVPALKCNTEKDAHGRLNHRTAGILAGVWPCGTITMLSELFGAESKGQVYGHLHSYLFDTESLTSSIRTICYDDGCHLKKYASNPVRSALTVTASRLSSMNFVIDRMHFKGHIDPWCRENCDPNKLKELEKVNTEVCEQTFSWLSQYSRITRHMNREHFLFYLLYLCELHNSYKK